MINKIYLCIFFIGIILSSCKFKQENEYTITPDNNIPVICVSPNTDEAIKWAVNDFADDIESIIGKRPDIQYTKQLNSIKNAKVIYIGDAKSELMNGYADMLNENIDNNWETFLIQKHTDDLYIVGSDIRGTIYGIFDLAERIGVSPWKWWADVSPQPQPQIKINIPPKGIVSSPSVEYRGIFLNDEDWGLQPWAAHNFERETGDIGPKTYEKIFQLLLRLKANTIWPAMHHCTNAFFSIKGNKEMAKKYHIVLGSSHAEPMLRNNVREWNKQKNGAFNYFNNSQNVKQYWGDRIEEINNTGNDCIFTMGMRGIHDSKMEGAANQHEMVNMMHSILEDQREILCQKLNKPIHDIPQILVPYKEVLDLYQAGMKVPEDITLMWCDDNYGYIRRLSNEIEQKRIGGSGVYYHISYWGRPHDYLWLSSTQPGLIWYEMTRAYQNGARKIWIVNVGDIKPAEYNTEFFLDLAWNINSVNSTTIRDHLKAYCAREFGVKEADSITDVMEEYYRLAFIRKPEFMGWSQTEPTTETHLSEFSSFVNNNELQRRINNYQLLVNKVNKIKLSIDNSSLDAFFQLVEYPVKGAALMNYKFLHYQLACCSNNQAEKLIYTKKANYANMQIATLTKYYNTGMLDGKWNGMMDSAPRNLPVFKIPKYNDEIVQEDTAGCDYDVDPIFIQAKNYTKSGNNGIFKWQAINGLGYSNTAITLYPFNNYEFKEQWPYIEYEFNIGKAGGYEIDIRCLPTHANLFNHELKVQIDDNSPTVYKLNTKGRSKKWKTNALRNFVSIKNKNKFKNKGKHKLRLSINHTGIVIDQLAVNKKGYPAYYEIPN